MKRDSFIFYRSFMEALDDLPPKEYKAVMIAIQQYALNGTEPNLSGVAKVVFTLVKPQIQANNARYENGCKGGRPRNQTETETTPNNNQTETKVKPNQNLTETKIKPNDNQSITKPKPNDNVNVNVNDNVNDNNINNNKNKKEINKDTCESVFEKRILEEMSNLVTGITLATFFEGISVKGFTGTTALLDTTKMMADTIDEMYKEKLESAIMNASNGEFIRYEWV